MAAVQPFRAENYSFLLSADLYREPRAGADKKLKNSLKFSSKCQPFSPQHITSYKVAPSLKIFDADGTAFEISIRATIPGEF